MKVKIILKHTSRVSAIKELRQLTGMGLQEAYALITGSTILGDTFEVNAIVSSIDKKLYQQFDIIELKDIKNKELVDELRSLICKCIWDGEIELGEKLTEVLKSSIKY